MAIGENDSWDSYGSKLSLWLLLPIGYQIHRRCFFTIPFQEERQGEVHVENFLHKI